MALYLEERIEPGPYCGSIFCSLQDTLFVITTQGGLSWSRISIPEPPTGPLAIGPTDRVLYVGTVAGVFRRPLERTQALPSR